MTRIIAGQYAGRRLQVPAAGARPTTDRVREAVFSTLTHRLGSWRRRRVLDLFAGSGALGLEALSRGAACATFVEQNRPAAAVIRRNIAELGLGSAATVVVADALHWQPGPAAPFDLVLADPPYALPAEELAAVFARLRTAGALADGALVVVERPVRDDTGPLPPHWVADGERRYGQSRVWYGRAQEDAADVEGT